MNDPPLPVSPAPAGAPGAATSRAVLLAKSQDAAVLQAAGIASPAVPGAPAVVGQAGMIVERAADDGEQVLQGLKVHIVAGGGVDGLLDPVVARDVSRVGHAHGGAALSVGPGLQG